MNLYTILELDQTAQIEDIRKSYRRLAKIHHPDVCKSDGKVFMELNFAYNILSDRYKRNVYDIFGDFALEYFQNERNTFLIGRIFSPFNIFLCMFIFFLLIVGLTGIPFMLVIPIAYNLPFYLITLSPFIASLMVALYTVARIFFTLRKRKEYQSEILVFFYICVKLALVLVQVVITALIFDHFLSRRILFSAPYFILECMVILNSFAEFYTRYISFYELVVCICTSLLRLVMYNLIFYPVSNFLKVSFPLLYLIYLILSHQMGIKVFIPCFLLLGFYSITIFLVIWGYTGLAAFITHFLFVFGILLTFVMIIFQYMGMFAKKMRPKLLALPNWNVSR